MDDKPSPLDIPRNLKKFYGDFFEAIIESPIPLSKNVNSSSIDRGYYSLSFIERYGQNELKERDKKETVNRRDQWETSERRPILNRLASLSKE